MILHVFGSYKDFGNISKFIHMRKYVNNFQEMGMLDLGNTGPREAFIRPVREAYNDTNKQLADLDCQVANKMQRLEALTAADAAARAAMEELEDAVATGVVS
jgi:hypothetical protein